MIKIDLHKVIFEKGSDEELKKVLAKVQARTKVREINYPDAYDHALTMVRKLNELLPGFEGIGAKITYIEGSGKFAQSYSGIPMGTRLTVTKHTGYATVQVDRYHANGAYAHKYNLDISQVKHPEKVMQSLQGRALRQYQKTINVKIDF